MNDLGLSFHHLGLAVPQPDQAIVFLTALGYEIGPWVEDPLQMVRLAMGTHASQPDVELITPVAAGSKGPVSDLVRKNPAGMIYHTCFETRDLAATLALAEKLGLSVFCVSEPKPAILFGGRKVSFYRITGMGLVELLEPWDASLSS